VGTPNAGLERKPIREPAAAPGASPGVWVTPADAATKIKRPWLGGASAIYCGSKAELVALEPYKDAWHLFK
jgi:hypothetical protein